jgi:hypothetical protein
MAIRKPQRGTEEERCYKWWWGGSIWGERGNPVPDEASWTKMNTMYDLHKSRGHSETKIHELVHREPSVYLGYGMVQLHQWVNLQMHPEERAVRNAELRS